MAWVSGGLWLPLADTIREGLPGMAGEAYLLLLPAGGNT